jgi:hypothetical protein
VNDKNDKVLVESLIEKSKSLTVALQLCGEAHSCSYLLDKNVSSQRRIGGKHYVATSPTIEKNGYLLLLQLSKEVSRNPLQLQEILQDFF